jgi:hypothetical protein
VGIFIKALKNLAFIGTERGWVHHLQSSSRQARWLFLGENIMPQAGQLVEGIKVMGDKSPKANQKKSSQQQAKTNSADQKKKADAAAKSAAGKKK